MDIRKEWNYRDRMGDRTYDRHDWRKSPTERFRYIAGATLDRLDGLYTEKQKEWIENQFIRIPDYETLSPAALIFGFGCLDREKRVDKESFDKMDRLWKKEASWVRQFGLQQADILRYARRWELWFKDGLFSKR